MRTMEELDLRGKSVLIREDFNVPMQNGAIANTIRIDSALATIREALNKGAKVILMSHLGRPKEGTWDPAFSLQPIADYLAQQLSEPVTLFQLEEPIPSSRVALLENVRFLPGEDANDTKLAKKLASLSDVFVMDAFAVAHRAQASTCGVADYAKVACAGPLLMKELKAIDSILKQPQSPVVAIVGGSKVSTKLAILENLITQVDTLIVGGGIANTFLAAQGTNIGASLFEPQLVPVAAQLLQQAKALGKTLWLPKDVVVANDIDAQDGTVKLLSEISDKDKIFDIGPMSQTELTALLMSAKTILWNGPVGVFENPTFSQGTEAIAHAIVQSSAFSVAGGGDTLSAVETFGIQNQISYLSTGGGAFLEALEGKVLPGVASLLIPSPSHA